jgi:hypothetical protein
VSTASDEILETCDRTTTCGDWVTENESALAFDALVEHSGCFKNNYHEVCGTLMQPRPQQTKRRSSVTEENQISLPDLRIDRILIPSARLLNAGWTEGAIGIELKRSGEKIGPPISQMIDYQRAVWYLELGGFQIYLKWIFLWPVWGLGGNLASVLAQNCLGTVHTRNSHSLYFQSGAVTVLYIGDDGQPSLGFPKNGARTGSR